MSTTIASSAVDYVIVGAGVSGLTLAYFLAQYSPRSTSILILDRDQDPDYNISFWSDRETPFEPIMLNTWQRIAVRFGENTRVCSLGRYHLKAFWRADFDAYLYQQLKAFPNVNIQHVGVDSLDEKGDHVEVATTQGVINARWVFDSRLNISSMQKHDPNMMLMQGLAWEIRTEKPSFDPQTATLFDFLLNTPDFDFIYVLPYTDQYSLVNCAFVTPYETAVNKLTCEQTLDRYIRERLCIAEYTVEKDCYGRIPLSAQASPRRKNSRIVPIGVRGGMVKSTTSYAFTRILDDSEAIALALLHTGSPYYKDKTPWYYRLADRHMVKVFRRIPNIAQEVMFSMFSPHTGDSTLAFLDEKNSLAENMALFKTIPQPLLRRFLLGFI